MKREFKKWVKSILRRAGWDLKKVDERRAEILARATMKGSLKWLAENRIPIETVLDVGASNGCWSDECMAFLSARRYLLFEPQPVHVTEIDAFARQSGCQVTVIKKAVGAIEGMTFFDASEPMTGVLSSQPGKNMIEVPITTIDASVAEFAVKGPFLLKLDTHGYEVSILKGAEKTLSQCSALIIEAYNFPISDEALLFWELCAELAKKGFRCVDLVDVLHRERDSALWQMDLVFIRDSWEGFNSLAYR